MALLDRSLIGKVSAQGESGVERLHLKMFCSAIGETDPIYFDRAAAQAAGYPDAVAPPTFLIAIENLNPLEGSVFDIDLPVDLLLHAEQTYTYEDPIFAGDELVIQSRITDIYEKKGGMLEFLESETTFTKKGKDAPALRMRNLLVLRHRN